jgi:hypothetical protein
MNQSKTTDSVKQDKSNKARLRLWRIELVLALVVTGVTVVGAYLLPQSDGNITSQVKGLGALVITIAIILLVSTPLMLYTSIRYVQLPAWRLMASRFKEWQSTSKITKDSDNRTGS